MKTASPHSPKSFRYGAVFAVALGLLAGAGSLVTHAANLKLTGNTTADCTYSGATIDAAGNLILNTTSNCILTPDALAFGSTPTSAVISGTVPISVTRANPGALAVSGVVSATNGCVVSNGGVFTFLTNTTAPATFNVTTPAAAAVCTISLAISSGSPGNLGAPNTFDINVTAAAPDVLAFSSASSSVVLPTAGTVNVTRTTTNSSSATVNAAVTGTGNCTLSASSVTLSAGSTTAPLTVTPTAAGTCTVTLTPGTGASVGTQSTYTLTATSVVVPPTLPPPPTGCATSANVNADIRSNFKTTVIMSSGQSAAVKFYAPGDAKVGGQVTSVHTTDAAFPPDIQVQISTCPGDFTATAASCGSYVQGETTVTEYKTSPSYRWVCTIDPTKTYYLNVRFPNCSGNCGVRVGLN